jgi:hypothetical protein
LLGLLLKRSLALSTLLRLASDARAARSTLSTVVRYADAEMRAIRSPASSLGGCIAR